MRRRVRRRNRVVWSSSASPADRAWGSWVMRPARNRRVRRFIRTSALLTVLGLMRFAGGAWPRGRLVLAGGVLTVAGIVLRSQPAGVVLLPGLILIFFAPLIPAAPKADRKRNFELDARAGGILNARPRAILKRLLTSTRPKIPPSYAPSSPVKLGLALPRGWLARDGTEPASRAEAVFLALRWAAPRWAVRL